MTRRRNSWIAASKAAAVPTANSFVWGDSLAKAFSLDHDPSRNYSEWLDQPGVALGAPLLLLFFGGGSGWPPSVQSRSMRALRSCAVPSLLVSGCLDVSTPPAAARDEALPWLERGAHVVVPYASHVQDIWGLQAVRQRLPLSRMRHLRVLVDPPLAGSTRSCSIVSRRADAKRLVKS